MKEETLVETDLNYTLEKFAPLVSFSYIAMHLYTFGFLFNLWNSFDPLTLLFSFLHLLTPAYTLALSNYQAPLARFVAYYFSSTITSIAGLLLGVEAALACLGMLA
jgi:hypothetical protein